MKKHQALLCLTVFCLVGTLPAFGADYPVGAAALTWQGTTLVVAGSTSSPRRAEAVGLLGLLPDGSPDGAFGQHGQLIVDYSASCDFIHSIASLPQGGFVIGGARGFTSSCVSTNAFFGAFVARFGANGQVDASFGDQGVFVLEAKDATYDITNVRTLGDGSVLFAGSRSSKTPNAYSNAFGETFLGRLTAQGKLDPSFGDHGMLFSNICAGDGKCVADTKGLEISLDGQAIYLAGAKFGGPITYYVEKYDLAGRAVANFGTQGRSEIRIGGSGRGAEALGLDDAGNIFLGGYAQKAFKVAKLDANGALVSTFGQQGVTEVRSPEADQYQLSKLLYRRGTLLVAGTVFCFHPSCNGDKYHMSGGVGRVSAETGAIDTSFGRNGFALVHDSNLSLLGDAIYGPQDQLYVGMDGSSQGMGTFAIASLDWTGARVKAFGRDGLVTYAVK